MLGGSTEAASDIEQAPGVEEDPAEEEADKKAKEGAGKEAKKAADRKAKEETDHKAKKEAGCKRPFSAPASEWNSAALISELNAHAISLALEFAPHRDQRKPGSTRGSCRISRGSAEACASLC